MNIGIALAVVVLVALAYFLSAGVAFALLYRMGRRFPSRVAGTLFAPLEWLYRRSKLFARIYNALCLWCYRVFVGGPLHGGWPPPPPTI